MQKSLELMQRRNRSQNKLIEEQGRVISKLYMVLKPALELLEELDESQHRDRGVGKYVENEVITKLREVLKHTLSGE